MQSGKGHWGHDPLWERSLRSWPIVGKVIVMTTPQWLMSKSLGRVKREEKERETNQYATYRDQYNQYRDQ